MGQSHTMSGGRLADALNQDCHCIAVDREALRRRLEDHLKDSELPYCLSERSINKVLKTIR